MLYTQLLIDTFVLTIYVQKNKLSEIKLGLSLKTKHEGMDYDGKDKDSLPTAQHAYRVLKDTQRCIDRQNGLIQGTHGKEVVDGLNDFDKHCIYQLMYKVKLPGSVIFDSQIKCTQAPKIKK